MNKQKQEKNNKNESKGLFNRMRRHKWRSGIIVFMLFIFLFILSSMVSMKDSSPIGQFRSLEGENLYKQAYEDAMELLPNPSRKFDINTDYGTVRIYEFTNSENPKLAPIVLLPGRSSGVPMWASNLEGLAAERTVIALDALGDAGMSIQTHKIENSADQAEWLEQVFDQLELPKMHLVGHSFGGWLAANYAVDYPDRIVSLNLLEPVFVFQGLKWQFYIKSIPASIPFLPKSWRDKMLEDIGGGYDVDLNDPIARMIAYATEYYSIKLSLPDIITKEQLKGLNMPVYAALAENSILHDSEAAVNVAKTNVKIIEVKNWLNASHSLPMEFPKQINQELLDFMSAKEEEEYMK